MTRSPYLVVGRRTFRSSNGSAVRGVFNTATADLFVVSEGLARALEDASSRLTEAQSVALERAGLTAVSGHDENYLSQLEAASCDLSARTFILMPTAACNMGCSYCGQDHSGPSLKAGYESLVVPRVIAAIEDPSTTDLHVNWFGGEPLLARSELFSIAARLRAHAAEHGVRYHSQLTTNGSLFTPSLLRELILDAGVTRIDVTVDGPRQIHDASRRMKNGTSTYDRILGSVGWALSQKWPSRCVVVLRTNVTMETLPHVPDYLHDLARRGLTRQHGPTLQVAPVHNWGVGTDAYEVSVSAFAKAEIEWFNLAVDLDLDFSPLPDLAHKPCSAGHRGTETIDPRGVVYDCPELALRENGPVLVPLGRAPRSDATARPAGSLMADMTWSTKCESPPCRQCSLLPVCGGACALSRACGQAQCPTMKHNFPERIDAALRRTFTPVEREF